MVQSAPPGAETFCLKVLRPKMALQGRCVGNKDLSPLLCPATASLARLNKSDEFFRARRGQLLEMANDGAFKACLGQLPVLLTFWMQVKAEFPEIATKHRKDSFHFQCSIFVKKVFCNQSEMTKKTGRKLHTSVPLLSSRPRWDHPVAGNEPRAPTDSALW